MKKINVQLKNNFLKKKLIQFCRLLGYEIIDQNSFEVPTLNKKLDENLSVFGKKSINIPLGEVKITRKIKSLSVYLRTCSKVNLWNQNKKRIFECPKSEYSIRSLFSILKSLSYAKKNLENINLELTIIDDNSDKEFLKILNSLINRFDIKNSLINLNEDEFKNITRDSNFSSILKSYNHAKENSEDLIYFVEDDYIHEQIAIQEMLLTYERISSQIKKEIIIFPVDYPFLYAQNSPTYILLGNNKHWRKTEQSLATLLVSKEMLINYWNNFYEFATIVTDPAEKPLHKIYENEACFSPIPSLAMHCTNINSIYGLSPNMDWKKLWEDNKL
jgi:hypothetical protein